MITTIKSLYQENESIKLETKNISVQGWVKSNRVINKIGFLTISDGSTIKTLQVVYKNDNIINFQKLAELTTGSALTVSGVLKFTSNAKQPFELTVETINFINQADNNYPIQKKKHSFEFLREQAHLRPRTDTFFAIFKIRSAICFAIHQFFQNHNFLYLNSPIITANDAEGAGENFTVTTISGNDYENDFFGKKASLTVSGQLNAEAYAQAFQKVYTFGPTFRAENSNTMRHAAEFWMVEPEIAFADLDTIITLGRDLIIFVVNYVLKHCHDELMVLNTKQEQETTNNVNLFQKLSHLTKSENYHIVTYDEVIKLLLKGKNEGRKFNFAEIEWGMDLQSEHERYLCEEVYQSQVFVINYPQKIKAFYMKVNAKTKASNTKTVAAMDLLVPGIGELIGGSVREDDYQQLLKNKKQFKITNNDLEWYFDLRKFGFAPSAGFGIGLERLVILITGINNIRDAIPFPRTPKNLLF